MAKKSQPKPFYPLYHEFVESAAAFAHQASMLADAVDQVLSLGQVSGPARDILRERVAAFNAIRNS